MTLHNKHIVVSGGGTGVGAEIATCFATAGADVTILGRRLAPLKEIADRTGAYAVTCDVTDRAALDAALADAVSRNGPVDIAIANAGAAKSIPFMRMNPSDLDDMLAVNLLGVFNLWQASFAGMKERGWGRLIAVASTAGLKGYPYVSGYSAAKHGVIGLMKSLSIELAKTGVTVNALCPGFIDTPLLERSIENIAAKTGMSAEDAAASLKSGNPQGRFIQTDEVAEAALWLCSDGARSINGQSLAISGGEI
ncbi:3-hydroxyacyl-CoA dehydrogenase [Marinosulfonomonas sp. PRT-SC04]|nr:3-hydroxyacyl-CoA dehydrogenase [Marinosulfonomonas sp. PRT-SC04]